LLAPYGRESTSSLAEETYIFIDLADTDQALSTDNSALLQSRLKQAPCPILGLMPATSCATNDSFLPLMDVIIHSEKEAAPLIKNIEKNPISAMTLVQLLRHNEHASIADGLLAESLAYATLQGGKEFKAFLDQWSADKDKRAATPAANPEAAVLSRRGENTLRLTLNRPELRNAFSIEMRDALVEGLELLSSDESIERAKIDGAGDCFCTGGYLEEFGDFPDTATAHAIRSSRNAGRLIAEQAERIEFYVHRACIGSGIELPAFAHRVVARADTLFQLPEITLGLVPGAGGTVSITKRIGRQKTAWLALSAKRINASTALEWGLIDEIAD
jgi:enoyl-CoA hydratase/carnithine racemase